ncbi:MAG TPA: hypothetical protein VNU93_02180, partial [Verrucomicrobiae bacterium]|nr:hypothetical protein [Verrucomicrobiae bacterium]
IRNLTRLTEAEARMLILAELEQEKIIAINAAVHAIDALPAPANITLQHRGAVTAVRSWVQAAIEKGAKDSDIANLQKLQDCEAKLASLEKMASFKIEAAKSAVVAINQLPEPGKISLKERDAVLRARTLVDLALQ